ncbi:MAG: YfcE family phosphodiesterase [Hydrocarboniphaga sp.]|nr:metallophosphoesterase family protein [Hydrocarboniphaga sp.]MDB5972408.1 YfcE family phosphodiesterase [Hydrocarboniphaga sp.]
MRSRRKRVGLISDTHGLLRPEALAFLRDCDAIIHGGDIGDASILEALGKIAPVSAVRGNNDERDAWAAAVPETQRLSIGGVTIYVLHALALIDIDPAASGIAVVVSGHSHRPLVEERGGVLYVNPGSAGPRRFKLPVSVGELLIENRIVSARIVELS